MLHDCKASCLLCPQQQCLSGSMFAQYVLAGALILECAAHETWGWCDSLAFVTYQGTGLTLKVQYSLLAGRAFIPQLSDRCYNNAVGPLAPVSWCWLVVAPSR
jgi:hypothetical protein